MKKFIIFLCFLLLVCVSHAPVFGDEIGDVEKEIEELRNKIEAAQSQERTLNSEIKTMDRQIKLTELQITDTQKKIEKLGIEIVELTGKIEQLEVTLSRLAEILLNRIVVSYKINRVSYLPLLFSANGFTDLINRVKYIQIAQAHDREVLTDVQLAKVSFTEQKTLRESKKQEQEDLKKKLESQNIKLNEQKKAKQALLTQTKNDEATYQKLLQQALAEKQALEAALVSGVKVGPVKAGDPIALVGNTGWPACSTGAHLHFEVRKDNHWVNAGDYLKSRTVQDDQNSSNGQIVNTTLGSGSWEWPLEGSIRITQFYGQTPYSWRYAYSGGIHTGIDMVSDSSNVIRAPKDGTLFAAEQNCGGSSIIKIKYIEHGDGVISFYLHVQ